MLPVVFTVVVVVVVVVVVDVVVGFSVQILFRHCSVSWQSESLVQVHLLFVHELPVSTHAGAAPHLQLLLPSQLSAFSTSHPLLQLAGVHPNPLKHFWFASHTAAAAVASKHIQVPKIGSHDSPSLQSFSVVQA